jgi:hypothetical protein
MQQCVILLGLFAPLNDFKKCVITNGGGDNKIRKNDEVLILIFFVRTFKKSPLILDSCALSPFFVENQKSVSYDIQIHSVQAIFKNYGVSFYVCTLLNLCSPTKFSFF